MDRVKILTLLLSAVTVTSIRVTVYETVDALPKNETFSTPIALPNDIFHLIIANESVPQLQPNFLVLENEASILQIIASNIREILPRAFNITPTLTLLRISHNAITTINRDVFNNIKVKEIDLSNNRISVIEDDAFDNNTHLEIVNLDNNQIKDLNPNWFLNCRKLYKLSAVYNDIKFIPAGAFRNMDKTRPLKITLAANRIKNIDGDAFNSHQVVQSLRLNGNKLVSLPEAIFVNKTIKNLEVSTNLLHCFPDVLFNTEISSLVFIENILFECACLKKVRQFAETNKVEVFYPSIICEDRAREVNVVFNYNRTHEIPLLPPSVDVDVYVKPDEVT